MKKFFVLFALLCGLSLGCQPSTPPADTTTTTPPTTTTEPADDADTHVHTDDEAADDTVEDTTAE